MITSGKLATAWSIVAVADFNGDGKADLLWRNNTTGANTLWHMDGGNQAATVALERIADTKWKVVGTGDYDGDGKADILWRNSRTGNNACGA